MRIARIGLFAAAVAALLGSCGGTSAAGEIGNTELPPALDPDIASVALSERIDEIGDAVTRWRLTESLDDAHRAAETALNLVIGPNGPGFGDRDGDGTISGENTDGLLPGLDGTTSGLAGTFASNECVLRDVLGGVWTDPGDRWDEMLLAIDNWRTDDNTMPTLASHPMRVVGWATFTLNSDSLDDAHEYAGHANLHVNISRRTLDC